MTSEKYLWWQTGIVYQIYPRSFQDANGDGVGDIAGITSRLDYVQWLGVTAIWISPCFKSPMRDFGYDVADYTDIDPLFGTIEDFGTLLAEAHRRGIRVLLDLVPNHTSSDHPWFVESRSSRDNPKRDWYIWRDGRKEEGGSGKDGGSPPNNWLANFGGIGWTWDEGTGQWYYHAFLAEQPDLNWRNPEVREAIWGVIRFWLDKGVDGFRVDVMNHMVKDDQFRDNPPNPDWRQGQHPYRQVIPAYSADQPEVHEVVREMRAVFDEYDERVIIGEIYEPIPRLMMYYGPNGNEAHLPFNFQLLQGRWEARRIAAIIDEYEGALPANAWPNWVLGNHDRPRTASRVGRAQARVAAMMLLTLRGTPTVYYGDEIGMANVDIPPDRVVDPPGVTLGVGRDPERTPMQWDDSANAGFSAAADTWLPIGPDYREHNVARGKADPSSVLTLHKRLIELRQSEMALMVGTYTPLHAEGDVLAFVREHDGTRFLVALNLGGEVQMPRLGNRSGKIVLSTHLDREGHAVSGALELRPDEGVVVRLA